MRRFVLAVLASGFALGTAVAHADTWQATADSRGQVGLTGFVDQPARGATITRGSGFRVSGWVADPSAQGWSGVDAVQLYWGVSGDGGVQIATGLVGQSRPDVPQTTGMEYWGSSGFSIDVSGWDLKPGTNAFTVYAHTPGRGWWALPFTVTIIDPYADKSAAAQTCQEESRLIQNGIRLGVAP